jgi:hypothetical protein
MISVRLGRSADKAATDCLRCIHLEEEKRPQQMDWLRLRWEENLLLKSTPNRVADQRAATEKGFPISNVRYGL